MSAAIELDYRIAHMSRVVDIYDGDISIYGLFDPRDGELRYVGKAKNPAKRLIEHMFDSQLKSKTHRNHWLKTLKVGGLKPMMVVLEKCESSVWQQCEIFWIRFCKRMGCDLVNSTDGGEGGFNPSPETRYKMGAGHRGKKLVFSEEHKRKIGVANRARAKDPEWLKTARENLARNRSKGGHPWSDASKKRGSDAAKKRQALLSMEEKRDSAMKMVRARLGNKRLIACEICGKERLVSAYNAKYCGDACCTKSYRMRQQNVQ